MSIGLALDLWNEHRRFDRDFFRTLFADASSSSPGRAGSKNGAVTWSGGTGGPFVNPYCGCLHNTNLCLWSQDSSNAAWTKTNATLTAAQAAPDGTLTAGKLAATAGGACSLRQTITTVAATTYTLSRFFKRGDAAFAVLAVDDGTGTNVRKQYFNLATGAVASTVQVGTYVKVSANMIDMALGDGTYRCDLTITTPAGTTTRIYAGLADADGVDSATAGKFAYVWGSQFELGNRVTDYVPTLGVAKAHCVYTRQALPGFTTPIKPQVVGNALDRPFRHDYRIGYNLLVNSAWDGAVAGAPGTPPTSWTQLTAGTGALAVNGRELTFVAAALNDRSGIYYTVTVAANTSYALSALVRSMVGGPLKVSEVLTWGTIPAGASVAYYKNGVLGDADTTCVAGDSIIAVLIVAGTAGTGRAYCGAGVSGVTMPASSVTLTEPQVEPGTVRSVYTPTTTAAIQEVICEPVKATEDGIFAMFHAQGARTNLVPVMSSNSGLASNTLSGLSRTVVENTANALHVGISPSTFSLTDGATYRLSAIVSRGVGSRHAAIAIGRTGQFAILAVDLDSGTLPNIAQSGGGTIANKSIQSLGGGRYKVQADISNAAWGGAVQVYGYVNNAAVWATTYTGDGVSSIIYEAVTLEAASFPGLPLGEGVALTAQGVRWNLATLTSVTAGEEAFLTVPYGWSVPAATAHPTTVNATWLDSSSADYVYKPGAATAEYAVKTDGGTQVAAVAAAPAETAGAGIVRGDSWDAAALKLYRAAAVVGSDATLSPPWAGRGYRDIACRGNSQQWFGGVAPFLANGRTFTAAERSLLSTGLARTLAFAA